VLEHTRIASATPRIGSFGPIATSSKKTSAICNCRTIGGGNCDESKGGRKMGRRS